jgi:hypothetical protein
VITIGSDTEASSVVEGEREAARLRSFFREIAHNFRFKAQLALKPARASYIIAGCQHSNVKDR